MVCVIFLLDHPSLDVSFAPVLGLGGGWFVLTQLSVTRWAGLSNPGVH